MTVPLSPQPFDEPTGQLSDELATYVKNKFSPSKTCPGALFADEPYIQSWSAYDRANAFELLTTCYPQLGFPIEDGINKTQPYIDAVLKGKTQGVTSINKLGLTHPESIQIELYKSMAGSVLVVYVSDVQDFEKITQCLLHKNNPVPIPKSMGAFLANGVVNWSRLNTLKANWVPGNSTETWSQAFSKTILPAPGLYKDKIMVLSRKPYSNVAADALNLDQEEWLTHSLTIRLEHECTHLYTLKRYGCAANNLHDELIADYAGISRALGKYSREWMLAFMGLENYPMYRKGARLENYVGNASLSTEEFRQLTGVVKSAIETIARFDTALGRIDTEADQLARIDALCLTDLLTTASANGLNALVETYNELYVAGLAGS